MSDHDERAATPAPMDDPLVAALADLLGALVPAIRADAALRASVSAALRACAAALEASEASGAPDAVAPRGPEAESPAPVEPARVAAHVPLDLGGARVLVPVQVAPSEVARLEPALPRAEPPPIAAASEPAEPWWRRGGPVDLVALASRCRCKAEACRWSVERKALVRAGADFDREIRPRDRRLADAAGALPRCHLWMLDPWTQESVADADFGALAQAYENLAVAADMARRAYPAGQEPEAGADLHERFLALFAEAQSAVRAALLHLEQDEDLDQVEAYRWVRCETDDRRIFLPHHMSLDHPADFRAGLDLQDRLSLFDEETAARLGRDRRRRMILNDLRYQASAIERADRGDPCAHHWSKIETRLAEWIDQRFAITNRELCETLAPVVDLLPDDRTFTRHAQSVFDAVDRFVGTRERERDAPTAPTTPERESPEVAEVRRRLAGRRMVLVGGERRPGAQAALEAAFGLDGLDWVSIHDVPSVSRVEPLVARAETALVVVMIRWCSHHVTEELPPICRRYGTPCVRLTGGYGPNSVAHAILAQASGAIDGSAVGPG